MRLAPLSLRTRIVVLAIVPLLLALLVLAFALRAQALDLARREKQMVETAWMDSKTAELRDHLRLAHSAIAPSVVGPADPPAVRQQALALLARMEFGPDGYFFVYDLEGRSLMHPRQPALVGHNLLHWLDPQGQPVIQNLIQAARDGGAAGRQLRYLWQKPSTGQTVEKLAQVILVPEWGWVMGTGLYLDDVADALARIDAAARVDIDRMSGWVALIAAAGVTMVGLLGLALNLRDHRQADSKLRLMAQRVVATQEDERARLSRELHDGVNQSLVSARLALETAIEQWRAGPSAAPAAAPAPLDICLTKALDRLNASVAEIRGISHNLRPPMLDDLGLAAALQHLVQAHQPTGSRSPVIRLDIAGRAPTLPDQTATALFRIAQEALTNALRHAQARTICLRLHTEARLVSLTVEDDGRGFDPDAVHAHPSDGIGLRNMRERVEALAGVLSIQSHAGGSLLRAEVPCPPAAGPSAGQTGGAGAPADQRAMT